MNAVRGFLDNLARLVGTRRPRRVAVASDADWRPAWRVALIPSYKAHRTAEPIPPGLIPQMPIIDAVLEAIGIDHAGVPDYEAEDVIATWATKTTGSVEIVSGDRDLFDLVEDPRVTVLYPEKAGLTAVDEAEVTRRYGIPGRSYAAFAILRGDPSDGLPGLKGVGGVAAAALIRRHGGIAQLLTGGGLSEVQREYVLRASRVVPPVRDLPIELPEGCRHSYPVDGAALTSLIEAHGLRGSCERLEQALESSLAEPAAP